MRRAPPLLLLCLALAACETDPVDGGPCTYEAVATDAVVAEFDTLAAGRLRVALEVAGPVVVGAGYGDGLREWVEVAAPDSGLAVGDRVPVTVDVITRGTCTPVIVGGLGG